MKKNIVGGKNVNNRLCDIKPQSQFCLRKFILAAHLMKLATKQMKIENILIFNFSPLLVFFYHSSFLPLPLHPCLLQHRILVNLKEKKIIFGAILANYIHSDAHCSEKILSLCDMICLMIASTEFLFQEISFFLYLLVFYYCLLILECKICERKLLLAH